MAAYKLKKVGKNYYRHVLKNGRLGNLADIPASLRSKAAEAALQAKGEPFTLEMPEATVRRSRSRYSSKLA